MESFLRFLDRTRDFVFRMHYGICRYSKFVLMTSKADSTVCLTKSGSEWELKLRRLVVYLNVETFASKELDISCVETKLGDPARCGRIFYFVCGNFVTPFSFCFTRL